MRSPRSQSSAPALLTVLALWAVGVTGIILAMWLL